MTTTPIAWPHPPRAPSGDWGVELPGNASIGELLLWAKGKPPIPTYAGHFIRLHEAGVSASTTYMFHDPTNTGTGAGPGTNVVQMDCRLLCRFDPTKLVHLFSLDQSNGLMFWTRINTGEFSVNYVSSWAPTYVVRDRRVAIPSDITAFTWVWIRQRVTGPGDLVLDYSLDHTNPSPSTWTPLGTWAVSSIPIWPVFGAGKPWFVGLTCDPASSTPGAYVVPTGNLDIRRVSYTFNGDAPALSTYEVDPVVVATAFNRVIHPDTSLGTTKNYVQNNLDMNVTVESE